MRTLRFDPGPLAGARSDPTGGEGDERRSREARRVTCGAGHQSRALSNRQANCSHGPFDYVAEREALMRSLRFDPGPPAGARSDPTSGEGDERRSREARRVTCGAGHQSRALSNRQANCSLGPFVYGGEGGLGEKPSVRPGSTSWSAQRSNWWGGRRAAVTKISEHLPAERRHSEQTELRRSGESLQA